MQARMDNPAMVVPDAMQALQGVGKALGTAAKANGVPALTLDLVYLRASQINGCSVCVDMHARDARKVGASDEQLFGVAAWRETPYFTDAERAALALAECCTRLNDRSDAVPDEVWAEAVKHYDQEAIATLVLAIATVNLWNRLNAATRQVAGAWAG
jgi:AhpD family alkylhydroperoxidase